jgi:hypothetical protein
MLMKQLKGVDSISWLNRDWWVAGSCEHGNESSGSTKCEEFIDLLRNYLFFKKDCAP